MTRFARAKGSKSSNERAPEDSTPWEVMKEQIIQSKKDSEEEKQRKEAEQQRIDNYNNFLKERKVQKRKATWCDFPEADSKNSNIDASQLSEAVQKKKKKQDKVDSQHLNDAAYHEPQVESKSEVPEKGNKKKKKKSKTLTQDTKQLNEHDNHLNNKKNKNNMKDENSPQTQNDDIIQKKKKSKANSYNVKKDENVTSLNSETNCTDKNKIQNSNVQKSKKKKNKDQKPIRRKLINDRSFQLIINGKEIELVRFDGFPIMKKDAERLNELKNSMIKKGIPKSEVQRTMKLERRRAEKALARMKREVCYNCRKGGHNLSDCPDLKSKIPGVDGADGLCFKCGSTEHRQFECKVQRDKEFRFATCFICKEAGHIARQCPDNPKGLYPNGGCCKLCGDVTHLKKDCPTAKDKKEESSIKLQTLGGADNIEDISQKEEKNVMETTKKPKKIKF